jgi:hypothetical protein
MSLSPTHSPTTYRNSTPLSLRILPELKVKGKELTVNEIKYVIYQQIENKQKQIDPSKHNRRIIEVNLRVLETMQFIYSYHNL